MALTLIFRLTADRYVDRQMIDWYMVLSFDLWTHWQITWLVIGLIDWSIKGGKVNSKQKSRTWQTTSPFSSPFSHCLVMYRNEIYRESCKITQTYARKATNLNSYLRGIELYIIALTDTKPVFLLSPDVLAS